MDIAGVSIITFINSEAMKVAEMKTTLPFIVKNHLLFFVLYASAFKHITQRTCAFRH